MPPVNPEVRTSAARQDDSSAPMQVSSGSFPTALLECAQRRKPADHVRKHPQSPPSSPMSSASRKKRPKDPDSPTTEKPNDQVQFSPGRHTDVAHEDELVLAADGPEKPLRDTPSSSLATAAVAPASFETIDIDSIPVNTSGHPSAVSSSSQMSTHDAETAAAQRLIRQWEDDYDIEVDVSDQEEENPPPPPEEEPEETQAEIPPIPRFPRDARRIRNPKERHKRLVATIVLSQVHAFRVITVQSFEPIEKPTIIREAQFTVKQKRHQAKSLEWSTPIEESKIPQIAPAEANPEQVVTIPVTQFAIFVQHAHRGFSAVLPSDRSQQPTCPTTRPRYSTINTGKHISLMLLGEKVLSQMPSDVGQSMQPGRGRQLFPEPRKQSECEVRRFHSNVTLFESQEDPGIMSHAAAVQPPGKVHLDQIKKFLETSTSTKPFHQQVDLPPAQLPPIAPSATPMRTSSNIAASPSQNGPESRAVPSSRQSPPPPLVTGTALNHDDTPYVLRKTRRKPVRYRD
uniref:Uncharacterized protein n=1 Tax=Caenorhabditis japonica TaxID=281687 RepID=A0A8R1ECZ0_CAEJA